MTSIEWLIDQMFTQGYFDGNKPLSFTNLDHLQQQAKEMHKQEMGEMYLKGIENYDPTFKRKDETLKDYHIVEANEMVKRGTLKKRMDKDAWFVVFQSNAYNENDMAYDLLKSQEIDIDMYDVYKDGEEVTFEVVNKKWAKITPFLYPFETTSSQQEISDEEINKEAKNHHNYYEWSAGAKWYREQLKQRQ